MYQTLKHSPTGPDQFKWRITWFEKMENLFPHISNNIAIAEYIGKFESRTYHASVKHPFKNVPYTRTKPSVKERLMMELEHKGVKEVERMCISEENDDYQQPRNEKQLRNIKHKITKSKRESSKSGNIADNVRCIEEMTKQASLCKPGNT